MDASNREAGYKREWVGLFVCVYRLTIVVVPYIADLLEYEGNKMMSDPSCTYIYLLDVSCVKRLTALEKSLKG